MQESTSTRARLSAACKLHVTGMVAAAAGITMQIASGSDLCPTIPPGPIILLAGAALGTLGALPMGRRVVYCPGDSSHLRETDGIVGCPACGISTPSPLLHQLIKLHPHRRT
jgi:hypothetical protein